MTNKEHYNDKPLCEAIAAYYKADELSGHRLAFFDWLDLEAFDAGHTYAWDEERGDFVDVDGLLSQIDNPKPVTGYLLEFHNRKTGAWIPSEFDCGWYPSLYDNGDKTACDDWHDNDTQLGFFPELGDVWIGSSDDWDFRLGVDFNADTTPKKFDSPVGIWGGEINKNEWRGNAEEDLWRVRKITIGGGLSEKAKVFFRKHPLVLKGLYH